MRHLLLAAALIATPLYAAPDPAPVIEADRAFAAMAKAEGRKRAFDVHVADDVIGVAKGHVSQGKSKFFTDYIAAPSGLVLEWTPSGGAISDDGTLGSTWGEWKREMAGKDGKVETSQGAYFTLWRKQPDGKWQMILDGGSPRAAAKAP